MKASGRRLTRVRHLGWFVAVNVRLGGVAAGLAAGGALHFAGLAVAADGAWAATTAAALLATGASVIRDLARRRIGVDVVAVLALAGSLIVGQLLAGAVIALMLATGRALEARASARARHELEALLHRAPTEVHRLQGNGVTTVPVDCVRTGDILLITPGEVVPVDGVVLGSAIALDESALTGESMLAERSAGEPVRSGGVNAGTAFRLRATATAEESTYAGIVRLVRQAQASRAPLVRLADRFALWFVPLTIATAALAAGLTHDLVRAVAVLVVATPCPLILAAPVALVGGMSRAARRGVVVKNGAALETLGRADIVLFDKTGTLTQGRARLAGIETDGEFDADEVLRYAASLDQASSHSLARPIVEAAQRRELQLSLADDVAEEAGRGIRGTVAGHPVAVGRAAYAARPRVVPEWAQRVRRRTGHGGLANVFVSVDGNLVGALVLEDPLRPDARRAVQSLRDAGVRRVVMVTGDHAAVAESVATAVGLDAVYADRSPEQKLGVVRDERRRGTVAMVGDGINDAPALASADVGVAMGVRGATASSEAADVVLMVDRVDRLAEALRIARRSHRIALESIVAGMGLSFLAMAVAASGGLVPIIGAVVQEAIDVAVILNALRAHGRARASSPSAAAVSAGRRVLSEHATLRSGTDLLCRVADELGRVPAVTAREHLEAVRRFLHDELLPHEHKEEEQLYPAVAPYAGGQEVVVSARREHAEVAKLAATLSGLVDDLGRGAPTGEELITMRRVLYSLHAVLMLHRTGEEERLSQVLDETEALTVAGANVSRVPSGPHS
jgi:heavy metal translocating P-type ATPase